MRMLIYDSSVHFTRVRVNRKFSSTCGIAEQWSRKEKNWGGGGTLPTVYFLAVTTVLRTIRHRIINTLQKKNS